LTVVKCQAIEAYYCSPSAIVSNKLCKLQLYGFILKALTCMGLQGSHSWQTSIL